MALDLSSKPGGESSKPPSPTLSMTSDVDSSFEARPTSAKSDRVGEGEMGFMGPATISTPGSLPKRLSPAIKSERQSPDLIHNPFKMFPVEAMTSMYSQMAASAASITAGSFSPFGATSAGHVAFPGMSGMEGVVGMSSSPIAQYLQQKKRRSESRLNRSVVSHSQFSPGIPSSTEQTPSTPSLSTSMYSPSHSVGDTSMDDTPGKRQRTTSGSGSNGDGDERRDQSYWERRRKNNEAAKRSRDARRQKEEEIALRAAFLEQENLKLRAQVTILKNETTKLHYMLYNRM